jgi:hypothetical protein
MISGPEWSWTVENVVRGHACIVGARRHFKPGQWPDALVEFRDRDVSNAKKRAFSARRLRCWRNKTSPGNHKRAGKGKKTRNKEPLTAARRSTKKRNSPREAAAAPVAAPAAVAQPRFPSL